VDEFHENLADAGPLVIRELVSESFNPNVLKKTVNSAMQDEAMLRLARDRHRVFGV
jgi:hypothetical protein